MTNELHDLVVLGAGPAGLTAALYGHRAGLSVLILGGDTPGGQVTLHNRVENYPGFPNGVTGAELMTSWLMQVVNETGRMLVSDSVTEVDFSKRIKKVRTKGASHKARSIIVATGSRPRLLSVPGESRLTGKGVSYCATCDGPLLRTMNKRRAAVVGAGNSAFCTALALLPHAESVLVVARGPKVRAEALLVERFEADGKGKILLNHSVKEIVGDTGVSGLFLENQNTRRIEKLPMEAVFVGIGQQPVTDFLRDALETNEKGFILTDDRLRTSAPGVFAAGDVRDTPMRQILTAAADGALAAQSAAEYLRESFC